jgi:hypothetical protein
MAKKPAKKTVKKKPVKKVVAKPVVKGKMKLKTAAKKLVKTVKKAVKAPPKKAATKKVVGRFDQSSAAVMKMVRKGAAAVSKLVKKEERAVRKTVKKVIKKVADSPIFAEPEQLVTVATVIELPPSGTSVAGNEPSAEPSPIEPVTPEAAPEAVVPAPTHTVATTDEGPQ